MSKYTNALFLVPLIIGPLGFIFLYTLNIHNAHITWQASALLGVLWWMLIWWVFEVVPLAVTALLPIVLMPIFLHIPIKTITVQYGHSIVFLFLGGFILGLAIQKSGLSKRIALTVLSYFGTTPKALLLGFMLPTAFLSLWISNTAATIMMLPIAISVLDQLELDKEHPFKLRLILSLGFAATIGGTGTLIGTPPNAVFAGVARLNHLNVTFGGWMLVGVPVAIVLLILAYGLFLFKLPKIDKKLSKNFIKDQLHALGPMSKAEWLVFSVFIGMAFLWIFGGLLSKVLHLPISSTFVAILGSIILFILPVNLKKREFTMDWDTAITLPWSVLILFGGGLAIAFAMKVTHLDSSIGYLFSLIHLSQFWLVLFIVLLTLALTNINSNTATSSAFMPIIFAIAVVENLSPLVFGAIIALASNLAFLLPMGTPPNNIVFGTKLIKIKDMLQFGSVLTLASIVVILLAYEFLIVHVY